MDGAARATLIRAFTLSLFGLFLGIMASALGVGGMGWSVGTAVLVTGGAWGLAFLLPLALSSVGGRAAGALHNPSGRSTPSRKEYSHAESLVARGLVQDAIDELELAVVEDGSDPEPYLRIARLYRKPLGRPEDAAAWFKRALKESDMPAGAAYLATRELIELYAGPLGRPERAAPLLARMADEYAGRPQGAWAAEELLQVKAMMADREQRG